LRSPSPGEGGRERPLDNPLTMATSTTLSEDRAPRLESFSYDDAIVRKFTLATVLWGVVGMLVGLILALQLAIPQLNLGLPWTSFGRLRPLHTNAVIFAFAGNGIFAAIYYSSQRLLKARMFSDLLSALHFWGWQAIIVSAAITLPLGITQSKEYAELEWPIDLAVVAVWVIFAINFFGTIARRRERHLYVAIWFYIATIVAIAVLYILNNLHLPVSWAGWKSYSVYAGVQDAFMQWWYGHNAVAFFLTTPFLGLMYYYLPKAAERPVFSYRLSILHFWSIVFIYIWAGPHHLHYTSVPGWMSTLGMLFSLMLWMPSWGGMLNGLLTLRGAWHKVAVDPVLKFFVVGVTFYGMSTFEGPMLSIKSVNALSHYTDWTIAHVHSGALGWNGMMIFGMLYWLAPRIYQAPLFSQRLATTHFWLGTVGIVLYIVPIYIAGLTQGLMWRAFDAAGSLAYGDFLDTVLELRPLYYLRAVGGTLYLIGVCVGGYNLLATWRRRPKSYEEPVLQAPALTREWSEPSTVHTPLPATSAIGRAIDFAWSGDWHRAWERRPVKFTVWVAVAVVSASLFEIVPTFAIRSNVPTIASVQPWTPLELEGRDIYVSEGCYNCHSQQIRPMRHETERYGEYSKAGEHVYDRPFQWGSRRIGPDLAREGLTNPSVAWHVRHFRNPDETSPGSIMPAYPWLWEREIDFAGIEAKLEAMAALGTPYEDELGRAEELARAQADEVFQRLIGEAPEYAASDLADKQVIALTAYMLRLGVDITKPNPYTKAAVTASAAEPGEGGSGGTR
jgi:cytochrome c oxidase cbb3-type subunit I/II